MKRVLILVARGVELLELSAFTDVFGWANQYGSEPIMTTTVGLYPKIACAFGPVFMPDHSGNTVATDKFDALAIPGGFEEAGFYEDAYSHAFREAIESFHQANKPIAAVCVGALALANSGILHGRHATTYHLNGNRRLEQLAEAGVIVQTGKPVIIDGTIITSSGPASAPYVALALLSKLTCPDNENRIKQLMGY